MTRLWLILPLLFILSCEDEKTVPYKDLNWVNYWTGWGKRTLACRTNCPNSDDYYLITALWIHYYLEEDRLEIKRTDGSILNPDFTSALYYEER